MSNDCTVASEIYKEFDYITNNTPCFNEKYVVSRFPFRASDRNLRPPIDKDGDLEVIRKSDEFNEFIEIEHCTNTDLGLVGLQIWRGAFLLSDWLIYNRDFLKTSECMLELASGAGLTGIVSGMFQKTICTDINKKDILHLLKYNINKNKHIVKYPVNIMKLDFTQEIHQDIQSILVNTKIILAADVVYDDKLTDAFVSTVEKLLKFPGERAIFVALEKRYVFTLTDLETCAPCYEYFLERISVIKDLIKEEIPIDFPQYFKYDRIKELVLWKIYIRK